MRGYSDAAAAAGCSGIIARTVANRHAKLRQHANAKSPRPPANVKHRRRSIAAAPAIAAATVAAGTEAASSVVYSAEAETDAETDAAAVAVVTRVADVAVPWSM